MKKSVLILLLVALLTVLLAIPAAAEDAVVHCMCGETTTLDATCESCETKAVTWTAYTEGYNLPKTAGNYYLTKNVTAWETKIDGVNVAIDLNGYTIGRAESATLLFNIVNSGTLTITDTSAEKTGKVWDPNGTSTNLDQPAIAYVQSTGTFNLYGGTLDASNFTNNYGANTHVLSGGTMNMYGGVVKGGTTTGAYGSGAIYVVGVVNMSGGTIYGGTAQYGGAMRINGGTGTLNMSGDAQIIAGTAANYGDAISVHWSGFITVTDNAKITGGDVYVSAGTATISGSPVIDELYYKGSTYRWQCICGLNEAGEHFGGCDKTTHQWTAHSATDSLPTSGYYYLTADVNLTARSGASALNLDLNGHTVTQTAQTQIFWIYNTATLTITDSSEAGSGKLVPYADLTGDKQYGGIARIEGSAVMNIYGGTLDASASTNTEGGAIRAANDTVVNLYGGTIIGGTVTGSGGAVYLRDNAKLNMIGGTLDASTGKSSYGTAIRIESSSATVNMYGGVIKGGNTTGSGGGALSVGGTFNMSGGTVYGYDITAGAGGAVRTGSSGGTINLSGNAKVIGGTAVKKYNEAIFVGAGTLTVSDSVTVSSRVAIDGTSAVFNVSGSVQLADVYLANSAKITVDGLTTGENGASICVDAPYDRQVTTGAVTVAEGACFYTNNSSYQLACLKDYVKLCYTSAHVNCLCGSKTGEHFGACDGYDIVWTAWSETASLPTSGNYYLTADVNLTARSGASALNLDLNGHTVTQTAQAQMFWIYNTATLTITDSSEAGSGKLVPYADLTGDKQYGGIARIEGSAVMNIYGGTLDASASTNTVGGAIRAANNTVVNLYGGTINGGTAATGGAVYLCDNATFNMTGGTITGGTASTDRGGNFYITGAGAKFNMNGGTITGGKILGSAHGGNLFVTNGATVTISGDAKISGGATTFPEGDYSMYRGGNIAIVGNATSVTIGGNAEVFGGAASWGGNIFVHTGSLTVQDSAKIYGGTAGVADENELLRGHDIYANAAASITVSGSVQIDDLMVDVTPVNVGELNSDAKIGIRKTYNGYISARALTDDEVACFFASDETKRVYNTAKGLMVVSQGSDVNYNGEYVPFEVAAYAVAGTDTIITLDKEITGNIVVPGTIYLDLNGQTISGDVRVQDNAVLKVFDNTTSNFSDAPEVYGKITGEIEGNLARSMNTPASFGHNYKYLVIKEDDGYSAHRIYMTVKSAVLTPSNTGIGYRTVLKCNEVVADHIVGYGVHLGEDYLYDGAVIGGGDENLKLTNITNVLDENDLADMIAAQNNAQTKIMVSALLKLDDDTVVYSAEVGRSLKDMVNLANDQYETLSAQQKKALSVMYNKFSAIMSSWSNDVIGNIRGNTVEDDAATVYNCYCGDPNGTGTDCAEAGHLQVAWSAWTATDSLPTGGNYYLTADVNLTDKVTLKGGTILALDLNGFTVTQTTAETRIFDMSYAHLIIADNSENGDGKIIPAADMVPDSGEIYGGIVNMNNKADALYIYGGILDASATTINYGSAVRVTSGTMTMYDGTIKGGTTVSSGGAISTASTVNLYGGTVIGGASEGTGDSHGGGAIRVSGGTLTIDGATIEGGTSAKFGGAIFANNGTINFHSGIINGGVADPTNSATKGGTIYMVAKDSYKTETNEETGETSQVLTADNHVTFNMTGGTIYGGKAYNGAGIYASNDATINISGGTFYAGEAARGGGAMKVESGVVVTLSGDTVIDGSKYEVNSANNGGGIFVENSTLTMTDNVVIQNCTAANKGGGMIINVSAKNQAAKVTMSGNAKVTGNTTVNAVGAGGVHVGNADSSGTATSELIVSGNAQITGNTTAAGVASNVYLIEKTYITVAEGTLADTASFGITIEGNKDYFANGKGATAANASRFFSDVDEGVTAVAADETLRFVSTYLVGYAEADLNPYAADGVTLLDVGLSGYGNDAARKVTEVDEDAPLIASVLAVTGDNGQTVLVISMDSAAGLDTTRLKQYSNAISAKTGILASNIVYNGNHQHSTPAGRTDINTYYTLVAERLANAAAEAMANRAQATMSIATVEVNAGYEYEDHFHYVRNYMIMGSDQAMRLDPYFLGGMVTDGGSDWDRADLAGYADNGYLSAAKWLEPESDADDDVQLVKFTREGASTVIMANFQAHPLLFSGQDMSSSVATADFIGVFRNQLETSLETDGTAYDVMYINGAFGNINPVDNGNIGGFTGDEAARREHAKVLPTRVYSAITADGFTWTDVDTGAVQVLSQKKAYGAHTNEQDMVPAWLAALKSDLTVNDIETMAASIKSGSVAYDYDTHLNGYGIYSSVHAAAIVERANWTEDTTHNVTLSAVSIGDVAFVAAPYEMFDTNGVEIKTGSPFAMTFINGLAQIGNSSTTGHHGYIPSALGYEHGGYSTFVSDFEAGTGELMVTDFLALLEDLK